ncbi:transposase [Paenibacillus sp. HWE-109]|nr:transposase [Paenibacillus sp. HWE-109]UKS28028.1 transposase [Paenibacillus sp. HWE-109]
MNQIAQEIASLLSEIPISSQFRANKGLGTIYIAAILAGAGYLKQYAHGRQLLRKAGLNLAESMSEKRKGQMVLSKRGDFTLRKYMYLATLTFTNPVFKQLHENNAQVKHMSKQKSIFKLLGKLARILTGMVHSKESFTPEKTVIQYTQAA